MDQSANWPPLPYVDWAPTRATLHMVSQMLGKARLALAPPLPEWLHTCLYLEARGLTTGAIPYGETAITIRIDLFEGAIAIETADDRQRSIPIGPDRTVAAIWADFRVALASLGITVEIWEKPQETVDTTPFSENEHDRTFDARQAQAFHRILTSVNPAFEEFRSPFFGRTGIQFWWGGFDFTVLLFTGQPLPPPDDRGYILRYDQDAEHLNAGFWPGDDANPEPRLYAYLVPAPPGCDVAPVPAEWAESQGEWILPYDQIRNAADPRATILAFLNSVYAFAVTTGGWNADAFRYRAPEPRVLAR